MREGDSNSATTPDFARQRTSRRNLPVSVLAFVTGFLAVLLLGLGILIWVAHAKVDLSVGIDEFGIKKNFPIHRFGLGAWLVGLGAWFTLLTRGLWQNRRYGRVLGWITLALVAMIALLLALT